MSDITLSYWNKTANKSKYPRLENSIEVDTLIIGSGITGITCAYCLAGKGVNPVVVEAGGLCDGTTGNTTGKLTIQHDIIYSHIVEKHGIDYARLYAESQTKSLEFVKKTVKEESIDCQLAENTAYLYASVHSDRNSIEKEYETARKLGIDAEFVDKPDFPNQNFGMLGFKNQAVFHSVRYVDALAKAAASKGAKIYCDTKAIKIENGEIITVYCENEITIKAKHVVMATQYPFYDGPNIFYTRLYAKRAYGIAVSTKNDWPDGSYINVSEPSRSIRTHVEKGERVLIVVGEGHATARGEDNMELHYDSLVQFAESIAGVKKLLTKWSAQDYKTPDQIPYIGRISDHSEIYAATGFGKWGLTNGTLAGTMIADLIIDGHCNYEKLYSRNRSDLSSSIGTAVSEVMGSVGELIKSKFEKTESVRNLKCGEGRVIHFDGQKAGIYRNFDDSVTILDISCTHMSTELNFNVAEKSWDCPAHGGRYSTEGKLLEGPPKDSLKVLFRGKYSDLIPEEDS
jgi:glycine/D-amino acid oxidase-like deaminating enzyme/nitrite reductase/ring-hydroxylating ferredoxin subunit